MKKYKINTKQPLYSYTKEVLDRPMGEHLANIVNAKKKPEDPMKMWIIANDLYNKDVVYLDQSDFEMVKKAVKESAKEDSAMYTSLVFGQIYSILSDIQPEEIADSPKEEKANA